MWSTSRHERKVFVRYRGARLKFLFTLFSGSRICFYWHSPPTPNDFYGESTSNVQTPTKHQPTDLIHSTPVLSSRIIVGNCFSRENIMEILILSHRETFLHLRHVSVAIQGTICKELLRREIRKGKNASFVRARRKERGNGNSFVIYLSAESLEMEILPSSQGLSTVSLTTIIEFSGWWRRVYSSEWNIHGIISPPQNFHKTLSPFLFQYSKASQIYAHRIHIGTWMKCDKNSSHSTAKPYPRALLTLSIALIVMIVELHFFSLV